MTPRDEQAGMVVRPGNEQAATPSKQGSTRERSGATRWRVDLGGETRAKQQQLVGGVWGHEGA